MSTTPYSRTTHPGPAKVPMPERSSAHCETCGWKTPIGAWGPQRAAQDHAHNYPGHTAVVSLHSFYRIAR
jgi:hypothetical protein